MCVCVHVSVNTKKLSPQSISACHIWLATLPLEYTLEYIQYTMCLVTSMTDGLGGVFEIMLK